MKALVALLSVAVVSSTHDIEKRSLLRVGQGHEHHEHHDEHERTGRDSPVSAPAGYLPPAEDDYADYDDDSAGFRTGKGDSTNNNVRRFGQQGQQSQYGQNERSPQSGAVGRSAARQSSNQRNQPDNNPSVKFGQRINESFQNTGLTRQQGSKRNQQGRGGNPQKPQRQNQFILEKDQDGSLGTYRKEGDQEQTLNSQQQGGLRSHTRQDKNQTGQGNNSQFDNLEYSSDQSQYGQQTGDNVGQFGERGQFGQQGHPIRQAGGQRNQQQGQGILLQRENIQFLQGQAKALIDNYGGQGQEQLGSRRKKFGQGNSQTQSIQFGQGGNSQQQRQGQINSFGNQQEQDQSADDIYGNNKSQIGPDQRGKDQGRQDQQGQNQAGQNQITQNQRGQNQRGQNRGGFSKRNGLGNQQIQGESADDGYGAPGQGQGNNNSQIGQRGQNLRGQNQRGQNQGVLSQGNGFGNQQVLDQSADESYGAPGQGSENNKFQIDQGQQGEDQRRQNQELQNQRGKNHVVQTNERKNQNIQNQRAFSSQFGSSGSITSTINRFLPSSLNNPSVNSGHGAPQFSGQNGQDFQGGKSGQNNKKSQTGSGRNSNSASRFAEQGVQQGTGSNGFPFSSTVSDDFDIEDTLICPGGTVESCIKVCPGNTVELYGGCVQGCADRCDAQDQAALLGQQGNPGQGAQLGQQGHPGQSAQLGQHGQQSISDQFNQKGQSGQFGNGQSVPFESQGQGTEDQQDQYGKHT